MLAEVTVQTRKMRAVKQVTRTTRDGSARASSFCKYQKEGRIDTLE